MRRRGGYYRRRRRGGGREIWTGNFLKLIAMIAMLADHFAVAVLEQGVLAACGGDALLTQEFFASQVGQKVWIADRILRGTGRIAFPIFCFLLTEGFYHSRDRRMYAARLGLFALAAEPLFDLAVFGSWFHLDYQNTMFTLFTALLVLMGMERFRRAPGLQIVCMVAGCGVTWLLRMDYEIIGILLPVIFYWFRSEPQFMAIGGGVLSAAESARYFGSSVLAYIPIMLYNGKRGKWRLKYAFYIFYPVQFFILYLIRLLAVGGGWLPGLVEKAVH